MITVVDYGMGNLRNVRRALEHVGQEVLVTNLAAEIEDAERLVLPGVGAFGEAIRRIDDLGLRRPLLRHVDAGKPLLGICLGMQLLFEQSEENPGVKGLGLLKGAVVRFPGFVKVPHIGWNDVLPTQHSTMFGKMSVSSGCFYFVHSFCVMDSAEEIASTDYGVTFTSAVEKDKVMAVQFHPEKSQSDGLALLKNFVER